MAIGRSHFLDVNELIASHRVNLGGLRLWQS